MIRTECREPLHPSIRNSPKLLLHLPFEITRRDRGLVFPHDVLEMSLDILLVPLLNRVVPDLCRFVWSEQRFLDGGLVPARDDDPDPWREL